VYCLHLLGALPLFFLCSDHHLDLHSFPTRRSSDLEKIARSCEHAHPQGCAEHQGDVSRHILVAPGGAEQHRAKRSDQYDPAEEQDRKSTRLNSSHVKISYAVFCLKKKKKNRLQTTK